MMEKAKEKLWLLKVPNYLMEHMQSVQDADVDLGTLMQDEEGSASGGASSSGRSFTLKLADSAKLPQDVPRELSVTLSAPAAPMHVVSEPKETSKGGAWRMEGKIVHKGEAKPKALTQEYKNMVARRVEKANEKREVQTFDESAAGGPPFRQGRLSESKADREDKKMRAVMKRQKTEAKPVPLTEEQIRDALFDEFARKQFASRFELMQSSRLIGQKQQSVNAVLSAICEHVKVGPNKGDFQLKPEFRGS